MPSRIRFFGKGLGDTALLAHRLDETAKEPHRHLGDFLRSTADGLQLTAPISALPATQTKTRQRLGAL
jgi:hypothetical protein